MQDEINDKAVVLAINLSRKGAKLTLDSFKDALKKIDEPRKLKKHIKRQTKITKQMQNRYGPKHGQQTVAQLMEQNQGLTNIEVTDQNIKAFQRVANKYNIDFALKKDKSAELPRYLVFFKARDVDVMTAAFKEFTADELTKSKKPSLKKKLEKAIETVKTKALDIDKNRQRVKTRNRGQEL